VSENKEKTADNEIKDRTKTKYDLKMEKRAREKEREKRELMAWKIGGVVILLAIIAFVASFPITRYMAINESVCTVGGRNVKRVEYDYNYNMIKNSYLNNYGSSLTYYGIDPSNIEDQIYPGDPNKTYKDYFEEETIERIKQTVALSGEIEREGYTADVSREYDEFVKTMKETAKSADVNPSEYVKESLGEYATMGRLEKYVKESLLISKFTDEKQKSFAPSDADIDARYKEDADDYDLFDYYLTRIDATLPTAPTELADEGAAVAADGTYTPSDAEKKAAMEEVKPLADEAEGKVFEEGELHERETSSVVTYQIRNWLIDPSRKEGDSTVIEAEIQNCYYVVGFVSRYMDEEQTISLRIISTNENNGSAIIDEFNAGGATEDVFASLADKYNAIGTSEGGLYEGLTPEALPGDLPAWADAAERKAGDVTFYYDENSSATYVCYYIGGGKPSWYYSIKGILENESMDDYLNGLTGTITVEDPKGNLHYLTIPAAEETTQP